MEASQQQPQQQPQQQQQYQQQQYQQQQFAYYPGQGAGEQGGQQGAVIYSTQPGVQNAQQTAAMQVQVTNTYERPNEDLARRAMHRKLRIYLAIMGISLPVAFTTMFVLGAVTDPCDGKDIHDVFFNYQCTYTDPDIDLPLENKPALYCCMDACSYSFLNNTCNPVPDIAPLTLGGIIAASAYVVLFIVYGYLYKKKRDCLARAVLRRGFFRMC
eukprot:CAMPEP_0113903858 /NCGR_PEP_ID=MMETSP0780_2-20120614/22836_1 /TAXON_ID=652834 /ORGANISM="Palpitomonas bilix" /LENGTH=213 /DNA_ID=CAMNT_0000897215 /DNA_START=62 /DNA_END=703 /DNA_ORIENTATION=- /assembly_acc=CAM_ASM_000599